MNRIATDIDCIPAEITLPLFINSYPQREDYRYCNYLPFYMKCIYMGLSEKHIDYMPLNLDSVFISLHNNKINMVLYNLPYQIINIVLSHHITPPTTHSHNFALKDIREYPDIPQEYYLLPDNICSVIASAANIVYKLNSVYFTKN